MTRREIERGRHLRLAFYAALSFFLATLAHFFLDLDRPRALAYGVCAFVLLSLLNYHATLARTEMKTPRQQSRE